MMAQSSLQDCYFYFYSSCTKGDECPFRHCESALGTETVCSLWREGRCFRSNCKLRHMESRINRSTIPCYWENQPGGCRKPHCVFLHRKFRNGAQVISDTPRLILPTSDEKSSTVPPDLNESSNKISFLEKSVESAAASDPSLTAVPPLVLSFDEGEESDTESVTSTPVKQGDKKAALTRNSPSVKASGSIEEKDFGIKTLEQIRMEKIHKESDGYYGAVYTSPPLEAPRLIDQHYPPKTEFIALPKDSSLDPSSAAPLVDPKLSGGDEEADLRGRLSSRRVSLPNKVNQVKRLVNFKKQNANQIEVVPKKLDFKIKTLEEIRREKENKQSKSEVTFTISTDVHSSLEEKPVGMKTSKKLKINRKPRELSLPAVLKQDSSMPNQADMVATNILVSNCTIEKMSSSVPNKNSSDSPVKRKNNDDSSTTASKMMKFVSISNGDKGQVNGSYASSDESRLHPSNIQSSYSNESSSSLHPRQDTDIETTSSKSSLEKTVLTSSSTQKDSSRADDPQKKEDRSLSVDEDLDEFLGGDDMPMDEMDAAPNDDILLQIEEFLES